MRVVQVVAAQFDDPAAVRCRTAAPSAGGVAVGSRGGSGRSGRLIGSRCCWSRRRSCSLRRPSGPGGAAVPFGAAASPAAGAAAAGGRGRFRRRRVVPLDAGLPSGYVRHELAFDPFDVKLLALGDVFFGFLPLVRRPRVFGQGRIDRLEQLEPQQSAIDVALQVFGGRDHLVELPRPGSCSLSRSHSLFWRSSCAPLIWVAICGSSLLAVSSAA